MSAIAFSGRNGGWGRVGGALDAVLVEALGSSVGRSGGTTPSSLRPWGSRPGVAIFLSVVMAAGRRESSTEPVKVTRRGAVVKTLHDDRQLVKKIQHARREIERSLRRSTRHRARGLGGTRRANHPASIGEWWGIRHARAQGGPLHACTVMQHAPARSSGSSARAFSWYRTGVKENLARRRAGVQQPPSRVVAPRPP